MQRETTYDPVFDAQEHYRLLLDAMARPGKINTLPRLILSVPAGGILKEAAALVGFALLNADVHFFVDGAGSDVATRYLLVNTSARPVSLEEADFVFASGLASAALVEAMKKGSLPYPEEGATLVLSVAALSAEASQGPTEASQGPTEASPGLALTLQGPGINGKKTFFVRGLSARLLEALQQSNVEFPLGVDLILTDGDGHVACIPRSSAFRWETI
jgi:alpha-D-ribose 1-methylphosphonate 5-triphosphate synthase subunit PhnH